MLYEMPVLSIIHSSLDIDNHSMSDSTPRRTFKPLYKSTGDVMSDKLAFFHILEELKVPLPPVAIIFPTDILP